MIRDMDGRIPLTAAQVEEVAQAASRRLSRIGGLLMVIGSLATLGFFVLITKKGGDMFRAIQGIPTTIGFWGLAFERIGKARKAAEAAKLANSDPASVWTLDGHRVFAGDEVHPRFRVSKKMLAQLTAMPRATLISK